MPHSAIKQAPGPRGAQPDRHIEDETMSSDPKTTTTSQNQKDCAVSETVSNRKVIGAWVMGGGIWLLGMLALMVVPMVSSDVNAGVQQSATYYSHSGAWKTITDPSGKYTAVVRDIVKAPNL